MLYTYPPKKFFFTYLLKGVITIITIITNFFDIAFKTLLLQLLQLLHLILFKKNFTISHFLSKSKKISKKIKATS